MNKKPIKNKGEVMKMKSGSHAMEILQSPKDFPKEYVKDTPYTVFRNGTWVNVMTHNMTVNKNYKPKKKHTKGIK
jgi:hypothetical protein